jgi:two-component system OmpR family response regulator
MHPTPHPLRILVVEDEPDIRELLVASLSQEAQVEGAADGQEALELLARGPTPSVILLDLRMPRLSGEGVLQALEQTPFHPPVVTMSACTHEAPRGSAAHLDKPFTIEDAMSVLRRVSLEAGVGPQGRAAFSPEPAGSLASAPRPPAGSGPARAPTPPPR